jgi:hypothetical protein
MGATTFRLAEEYGIPRTQYFMCKCLECERLLSNVFKFTI